jgi:hypothetical protein
MESRLHLPNEHAPQKVRACYVDFDGVLHDDAVYWGIKRGIHIRTPGRVLFEWMPILEDLLAPHPDIKIVLSTSWVRVKSFEFAKKQLAPALQERVIGSTYHRRHMRIDAFELMSRGHQILRDVERRKPVSWFAIDNDDFGWPDEYRDRLIRTEDHLGLSDRKVQDAIRNILETL